MIGFKMREEDWQRMFGACQDPQIVHGNAFYRCVVKTDPNMRVWLIYEECSRDAMGRESWTQVPTGDLADAASRLLFHGRNGYDLT